MKNKNLHKIKTTGFKTPDAYFESFDKNLINKLKEQTKFDKLESSGFEVPIDYFKNIEETILAKVSKSKGPKVISLFTKRNIIYVSSIAAAVLLLFNLSIFKSNLSFDSLDSETVENYMINEDISFYEIASLLPEEGLIEENFIKHNFNTENVEIYLLDNLDVEDLFID